MASQVSVAEVRHVAALARLGLTNERAEELARELNTILEHMTVLNAIDTTGVQEATASDSPMRTRDDSGPPIALDATVESFAPAMKDGLIQVPRLSTHEQAES